MSHFVFLCTIYTFPRCPFSVILCGVNQRAHTAELMGHTVKSVGLLLYDLQNFADYLLTSGKRDGLFYILEIVGTASGKFYTG